MHENQNNRIASITPEVQARIDDAISKNVASLRADMLKAVEEHPEELRQAWEQFQQSK